MTSGIAWRNSINWRLNSVFVLVVLATQVSLGTVNYQSMKRSYESRAMERVTNLEARLGLSLPSLLWNFNNDQIAQTIAAELGDADIVGIVVKANNALVLGRQRGKDGKIEPTSAETRFDAPITTLTIVYDDNGAKKTIGSVEVAVSTERMDSALHRQLWIILAEMVLVNLVLSLALWFGLRKHVFAPLREISTALEKIASGDADLTKQLLVRRRDEIGEVAHWFNVFVGQLRGIVEKIAANASGLSEAADLMTTAVENGAQRAAEQNEIISGIASALDQVSSGISSASEQSEAVREISARSGALARQGTSEMNSLVAGMQRLSDSVNQTADTVSELGKESEKINSVVSVIKEIAEQTNLLALNAAIEAARAGDTGRGFAVVADEVRKLAERTTNSTGEINTMIGVVQTGIQDAVEKMNHGVGAVMDGMSNARKAGDTIGELDTSAGRVEASVGAIASVIGEQRSASKDISGRVDAIVQLAQETKNAMANGAASARAVNDLSMDLRRLVGGFKV